MKFKNYLNEEKITYKIPFIKKTKEHRLNPRTNRMKNFKTTRYFETTVLPEERSFKNIPKYSTGNNKCRFQDWLEIKGEKLSNNSCVNTYGKSCNGKWYGWSHRAVYGFKEGDLIKSKDSIGKCPKREVPYKIENDEDARQHAIRFAKEVS